MYVCMYVCMNVCIMCVGYSSRVTDVCVHVVKIFLHHGV
jgi:hypothetical protein